MTNSESTIDKQELQKFAQHSAHWWDTEGPLKTLHDINSTRLEFISDCVNLTGVRVLDVGCGGGILSESMAKKQADVTGVDAEIEVIKAAELHAQNQGLPLRYLCTPIEEYKDDPFDVITCMELLEHVPQPEHILQQCNRLLKKEGLLFLSTINRSPKAYATAIIAAEYLLKLLPRQTHDYDKFIRPSELASMARACGFTLIDLKGINYNPITRVASLCTDVSVNYLMALRKES
ncbi:bifunctional 2-polyprenyl-6-hydroxyphenol methylase/3-demethylubiquinol 3-O-methyltransferase UbiG [Legionella worsleiensis]|uniref:Ubiquinone biosynthesis O-methyltransferase n=1 Tax=Legionella worsleiensis TaxID=45076 RepID=A0A0W1AF43_9GAMM|nr:bifunctional 2-polyprenyl-6-hydroxyphenol methylase/3-demethylubiquinol 3-O-methyltransferase UbiG [Legionella worsleiensis]KTD79953.1 3-demethylubiquinone-9 3-methyltransferase [Legionella worsleiensis]STY33325.1 3-demethylubiquinone-9 3-methyltransferase [Legionella worsleiensis]